MIPAMMKDGYPGPFAAVVTCTSSVMGNLIPPAIDLIIYGWLTGTPIDRLLAAGLRRHLTRTSLLPAILKFTVERASYLADDVAGVAWRKR